jgi:hypothetical protein
MALDTKGRLAVRAFTLDLREKRVDLLENLDGDRAEVHLEDHRVVVHADLPEARSLTSFSR